MTKAFCNIVYAENLELNTQALALSEAVVDDDKKKSLFRILKVQ